MDLQTTATLTEEDRTRARGIRETLPKQLRHERLTTAALLYGPLYTSEALRGLVAETLPHRVGFRRGARFEPIDQHEGRIPDEALLKYDDALQTGLFSRFMVATPAYYAQPQTDPWIVAEVDGTDQWVVIARWD